MNHHKKTALFGFTTLLLATITIILTGCRGAYLGLLIELILVAVLTYKFLKPIYKKLFIIASTIITFISSLAILTTTSLRARIFSIFAMRNDSSNSFRFNVYNSCIEMFKDNWLLGIGVGNQNFREIYGLYMKTGFDALSAYNIYLEIAVESGIFALITFACFILYNTYLAFRYISRKNTSTSIYLAIAVISITGMLTHGLVDTVFFRPQIQFIFWIMIGTIRVLTSTWGKHGYKK
jgi:putative inorganic carbon (HCO3(-)) transporter